MRVIGLLTHLGRKIIATAHAEDPSLLRVLVGSHMSLKSSQGIEVITPVVDGHRCGRERDA